MPHCKKCKKDVPRETPHKCEGCSVRLCRECDDRSDFLVWVETSLEEPDKYLCKKCRSSNPLNVGDDAGDAGHTSRGSNG